MRTFLSPPICIYEQIGNNSAVESGHPFKIFSANKPGLHKSVENIDGYWEDDCGVVLCRDAVQGL